MKLKKQIILIISLLAFTTTISKAQEWVDMHNEGKSFEEIKQRMEKRFKGKSTQKKANNYDRAYKKYARWEYIWRFQTDENGHMITPFQARKALLEKMNMDKKSLAKSATSNWSFVGQSTIPTATAVTYAGMGRVNAVAVSPTNPNTVFAGAANGGLWKSTNGGTNWTSVGGNLAVLGVSDIALSQTADTVYIATGDADAMHSLSLGVLKSVNGGSSFTMTGNLGNPTTTIGDAAYTQSDAQYAIHHLWIDPTNAEYVVATTTTGIYRTTNGGTSWTREENFGASDLEAVILSDGTVELYVGITNQISKSTDKGDTWGASLLTIPGANKIDIAAMDNGSHTILYALGDNARTYKSLDSGSTWTETTTNTEFANSNNHKYNSQGGYNMALAVHPSDQNKVILGGQQGYITANGTDWGVAMNGLKDRSAEGQYMHADHHMIIFDPHNPNVQYSAHDGGIHKGNFIDTTSTWTDLSTDLKITQYYGMDGFPGNENILIAGAQDQDGVFYDGTTWKNIANNNDGTGGVIDHQNSNVSYVKSQSGGCQMTTDAWVNSVHDCSVSGQGVEADFVWPLEMDPSNSANVYAGYNNIYKTTNQAQNWSNLTNHNDAGNYTSISVSPKDGNVIYAVRSNTTISKTIDGGTNWTNLTNPVNTGANITKIEASLTNKDSVYLTYGNYSNGHKVYVSANGGSTWTNISSGIPNFPVYSIAEEAGTGTLFAGTEFGVYRKESSGNWVAFNTNLPAVRVNDLNIFQSGKVLRAATFGRGIWKSPIGATQNTPCNAANTKTVVQNEIATDATFHDGTITSGATGGGKVTVNANNVTFRAVSAVNLNAEFEVSTPNVFTVEIAPCPSALQLESEELSEKIELLDSDGKK